MSSSTIENSNPGIVSEPGSSDFEALCNRVKSSQIDEARIVVVDDEEVITQMIRSNLNRAGFSNVTCFADPLEALRFIGTKSADLVLLDLNMPNVNGLRILQFLRDQKATVFLPVIILTSADDEKTKLTALECGANDYLTKPVNSLELIQRLCNTLAFHKYTGEIKDRVSFIEKELRVDVLTQLNNRRAFDDVFPDAIKESKFYQLSLILLDVDRFKKINDQFGHEAGDSILKTVGGIIKSNCGPQDTGFRIGGDEFAVVCRHSDPAYPQELARRIHEKIDSKLDDGNGLETRLSASIGIATYNEQVRKPKDLFNTADSALYQSKRKGRNQISYHTDVAILGETQIKRESKSEIDSPDRVRDGLILIVDDEPVVTQLLEIQLRKFGYRNIDTENRSTQAIEVIQDIMPDLIILDVRMPVVSGMDILREIKNDHATNHIPVLIMTSSSDEALMVQSLQLQASDFLTKPAKPAELDARVFNSLKIKQQHDRLRDLSIALSREIDVRSAELYATRREAIYCLARAAESRDHETGNHVIRVGKYAAMMAQHLGMDQDFVGWIELAAQLHDVGKLSIPDAILQKPGKLTAEERKIIETHCDNAADIFFGKEDASQETIITSPVLRMAERIASTHHEKWDGSGYPHGLSGESIPIEGRITAVADVFDALSSKRSYKDAIAFDKCMQMIVEQRGQHFDPMVVDAFVESREEVLKTMVRLHSQMGETR